MGIRLKPTRVKICARKIYYFFRVAIDKPININNKAIDVDAI